MLILMQGYPASGKTTAARQLIYGLPDAVIVCRDDLRLMLHGVEWTGDRGKETQVTLAEDAIVKTLLHRGLHVVVDATNLSQAYVNKMKVLADRMKTSIELMPIRTDAEECVRRDAQRGARGEHSVGAAVIRKFARQFPIDSWETL